MVPEPQAAAPKAKVSVLRATRRAGLKPWPLLWTMSAAIVLSLLLWAGIFFVGGLLIDALGGVG
jgi:hypothetical protein